MSLVTKRQFLLKYGFNQRHMETLIGLGLINISLCGKIELESSLSTEHPFGIYSIDEAFPEFKISVEIDGCYWHGCQECGFPALYNNDKRDFKKTESLLADGWKVVRIKEHDIKNNNLENYFEQISIFLKEGIQC